MWTFGRKIALGFAASLVLFIVIGVVAYAGFDTLVRNNGWVTHTHQVLEHVTRVISQVTEAETGQRGYVITGDPSYLEPYRKAIGLLPMNIKELAELTADNPRQ